MGVYIIAGTNGLRDKIRGIRRRTDNPRPAWPKVGRHLDNVTERQFRTNGAYLATPWKPLRPDYRLWKVRNAYSNRILIMTGEMRRSFKVLETRRHGTVFGSTDRKAPWHQYGTKMNGKPHVPARPMLRVTPRVRRDVRDIMAEYIIDGKVM